MSLKVYSYPNYFLQEDWGLVTSSSTESIDLGLVTAANTDQESYGLITDTFTLPFGTSDFSSSSEERSTFSEIGSGTLTTISGSAEVFGANPPENTVLGTFSGSAIEKYVGNNLVTGFGTFSGNVSDVIRTYSEIGFGTFFAIAGTAEAVTYDYNETSIVTYDGSEDFGSVGVSTTLIDDYGSISDVSDPIGGLDDYGSIGIADTTRPFGLFTISGSAIIEAKVLQIHTGLGTITASGTAVEKSTGFNPVSGIATFSSAGENVRLRSYVGLGTLSLITGAAESKLVSEVATDLFTISGAAEQKKISSEILSGVTTVFGSSVEKVIGSHVGIGTIGAISGAAESILVSEVATDLLIISGTKIEKKVYDYNETSIYEFLGFEDYGLITDTVTYEDYGLLGDYVNYESYGNIAGLANTTVYPFGSFSISGTALESSTGYNPVSGIATFSNASETLRLRSYVGSGIATFSGISIEKVVGSHVGTGTFFAIAGTAEAVTYDYNETSIVTYDGSEDFGSIGISTTLIDDYGSITNTIDPIDGLSDYGSIGIADTTRPFGLFTISGSANVVVEVLQIHTGLGTIFLSGTALESSTGYNPVSGVATFSSAGENVRLRSYYGSGSVGIFSGSAESFGANPPENIVLGTFSGTAGDQKLTFNEVVSGVATFSNAGDTPRLRSYVGLGTLSLITGAAESKLVSEVATDLFAISGTKIENRSYDYNEYSIYEFLGFEDYGLITDSVTYEDYGLVTDYAPSPYDNYGIVGFNTTVYPYGTVNISGIGSDIFKVAQIHTGLGTITVSGTALESSTGYNPVSGIATFSSSSESIRLRSYLASGSVGIFSGSAEAFGANPPENIVLGTFSGTAGNQKLTFSEVVSGVATFSGTAGDQKLTFNEVVSGVATFSNAGDTPRLRSYVGLGTLFAISGGSESITYDYNIDSITIFESYTDPYGSLLDIVTYDDLGSITNPVVYDDLGSIGISQTSYPFGLFNISGTAGIQLLTSEVVSGVATFSNAGDTPRLRSYVGLGTLSLITGAAESRLVSEVATDLFTISGTKIEKKVYDYNEYSIYEFLGFEDYGLITDSVTYEDYGSISDYAPIPYDNYGIVGFNTTVYPYGTVNISGIGSDIFKVAQIHTGLGTIFLSGTALESSTGYNPVSGIATFSSSSESIKLRSYVGTGTFFAIAGTAEAVTYDYNETSIAPYDGPEDFGSIGVSTTLIDDYGSIVNISDSPVDYGFIGIADTTRPFGLFTISGSAVYSRELLQIHTGLGTIFLSGTALESFTGYNPVSGIATFSSSAGTPRVKSYIGSGSVGIFSGSAEAFGANPPENIVLGTFSGTAGDQKLTFNEVVSGVATFNNASETLRLRSYVGLGTLTVLTGAAEATSITTSFAPPILTEISGTKIEKKVYDYNETSIYEFLGFEDYGLITDTVTYEDYGLVTDYAPSPYDNYGNIAGLANTTVYPYGTVNISGIGSDIFKVAQIHTGLGTIFLSGASETLRLRSYVGLGTIGAISGAAESRLVSEVATDLFTLSGTSKESFTPATAVGFGTVVISGIGSEFYQPINFNTGIGTIFLSGTALESSTGYNPVSGIATFSNASETPRLRSYVGTGTFFAIAGTAEAVTYDYNETSIAPYSGPEDFGSIGVSTTLIDDYGSITSNVNVLDDYGFIGIADTTRPFGLFTISGSHKVSFTPATAVGSGIATFNNASETLRLRSYVGLGTLSVIRGAAEATSITTSFAPPILTEISGTKIENRSYSYNEYSIYEFLGFEDYGLITDSVTYEDYGLLGDYVNYESYGNIAGLANTTVYPYGTVNISGGITQNVQIYVPLHTGIGTISLITGAAESRLVSEVATDLFTLSGTSKESFTPATAVGSGIATFSGTSGIQLLTFSEVGSGIATIFGSAYVPQPSRAYSGIGTIVLSGTSKESFTPGTAVGFGTLSVISGSAEVFGANPPENIVLGTFSGTAGNQKLTFSEVVSGVATFSNSGETPRLRNYSGSGSINITGSHKVSFTPATAVGFGTFSIISGAAESRLVSEVATDLFTISGTLGERFVASNSVSGIVTFIGGAIDKSTQNIYRGSGAINFASIEALIAFSPSIERTATLLLSGLTAKESFTPTTYIGSGIATFSGISSTREIASYQHVGFGTLSTISGSSESFGPAIKNIVLGTFTGSSKESFTPATSVGSGIATFSGIASTREIAVQTYVGSGIATFSGAASTRKLVVQTHIGSGIATFSGGIATDRQVYVPLHTGIGTIFTFSGSAEVFGANPPENTVLGIFSGIADAPRSKSYIGLGTLSAISGSAESRLVSEIGSDLFTLSGSSRVQKTNSYIGVGTLSVISGSAEVFGANPPENTVLGTFSGIADAPRSKSYIGLGTFRSIGGSAEAFGANPPENIVLGTFSGSAITREIGVYTYSGIGTITISGGITTDRQVYVPLHTGIGTISVIRGSAEVFGANPKENAVLGTFSGRVKESFTPATYIGFSSAQFIGGISTSRYIEFVPGIVFVQII